jgi:hypothetical protein
VGTKGSGMGTGAKTNPIDHFAVLGNGPSIEREIGATKRRGLYENYL